MPTFTFLDSSSDILCCICYEPWRSPVECLPCSHILCNECYQQLPLLQGRNGVKSRQCPQCRCPVEAVKSPNRVLQGMANSAPCRCNTCGWKGCREGSSTHVCQNVINTNGLPPVVEGHHDNSEVVVMFDDDNDTDATEESGRAPPISSSDEEQGKVGSMLAGLFYSCGGVDRASKASHVTPAKRPLNPSHGSDDSAGRDGVDQRTAAPPPPLAEGSGSAQSVDTVGSGQVEVSLINLALREGHSLPAYWNVVASRDQFDQVLMCTNFATTAQDKSNIYKVVSEIESHFCARGKVLRMDDPHGGGPMVSAGAFLLFTVMFPPSERKLYFLSMSEYLKARYSVWEWRLRRHADCTASQVQALLMAPFSPLEAVDYLLAKELITEAEVRDYYYRKSGAATYGNSSSGAGTTTTTPLRPGGIEVRPEREAYGTEVLLPLLDVVDRDGKISWHELMRFVSATRRGVPMEAENAREGLSQRGAGRSTNSEASRSPARLKKKARGTKCCCVM